MNSRNNRLSHPRILLAIGCGLAGLIAAADSSVDVATKDPGFYMHHFEFDPGGHAASEGRHRRRIQ